MFAEEDIVSRVTATITAGLQEGPDVEELARTLNMSSRTLRRRLGERQAIYQQIFRDARCQDATAYLRDTRTTIDDIATRVVFTESANFRHAFKRWTRHSLSFHRKQSRY